MRAIILAGGLGTRLEPFTVAFPKPLVPVGNMPILEIVVRQLKHAGFDHITMAVGYLAELIQAYFGDGSKWGVKIDYSKEEKRLGTVGPLSLIDELPEDVLVMNGDILTTLDYAAFFDYHVDNQAALTITCRRFTTQLDFGAISFDDTAAVTGYQEKPLISHNISMGIYAFNRRALQSIPTDTYIDLPTFIGNMLTTAMPVKIMMSDDEWLDIGRRDDYRRATETFCADVTRYVPDYDSDQLDELNMIADQILRDSEKGNKAE